MDESREGACLPLRRHFQVESLALEMIGSESEYRRRQCHHLVVISVVVMKD